MDIQRLKPHLPWITLTVLVAIVGMADPGFLKPQNLMSLAGDIVPLFIMALGLTFAIYIGGIDLSAQSMANMVTVIASVYLASMGAWVALLCVAAGFLLGTLSGYITTRLYVPSFISTLAVGGVAFSVAQWLSGQRALNMDAAQRNETFGWMIGRTWGVPNELLIAAVLLLVCLFIERRTILGRALKAVGAGELAAAASGLNVARYKILAFAISGALAAIAGLLFAVKLSGGAPTIANGFLLPAIVAVLVGGTPLTGGVGGVLNTVIGTLIVAVIRASMLYFEIDATQQQMVFGIVLIGAIALTIDRAKLRTVK
ncbi:MULTISPECIES: ABC transporter permease [Sinorhizobium]|uniref:ABC transporter, permease n=4 Tax=Sinorhizobium TaxID=28105 RepID=Q92YT7_RHIME|nr:MULTISPECIES: ABC transporter permease [Sinorhizobium]TWA95712.1 monosaccharide ABC transporter membrane protein (CUT2 family) [Ensifer sp. SEMIA 134]TWB31307.1 monosaccharide ABC transporter membrane protein (CUT2 family) [Ensifer sp. SEMIA 135]AAK65434.1 ABC transporter, permease [Sinorhizobium meliloti 1021]AEG07412.1 ABC-type transporter, integral membrane subunit [Sinorhizobium meliloti BL225C]AEG57484.1 ABC-type transporter, integral membrane subunit [Sinorhizobium meliloti AK83]